MLSYPTPNEDDIDLLNDAYEEIRSSVVEIVVDTAILNSVLEKCIRLLVPPIDANLSIANLFRLQGRYGHYFIVQLLLDYGYLNDGRTINDAYKYYLLGIASLREDFGNIHVRPKTRGERLLGRLIKAEVIIAENPAFNKAFYIQADDKAMAIKLLDSGVQAGLQKSNNTELVVKNTDAFLKFEFGLQPEHSKYIQYVFNQMFSITD